jgi:hypothetical protein
VSNRLSFDSLFCYLVNPKMQRAGRDETLLIPVPLLIQPNHSIALALPPMAYLLLPISSGIVIPEKDSF